MAFCISFGTIGIKYFVYCFFLAISELYINFIIYKYDETILADHQIFGIFCYYFGYLLNIIPIWFVDNESIDSTSNLKSLSTKDIVKFIFIFPILILIELIEIVSNIIDDNQDIGYNDDFILYLILIMFILPKFFSNIVFYKHQKISFFAIILIEIINTIFFLIKKSNYQIYDYLAIILNFLYSLSHAIFYFYIGGLMKYKYISPYKCAFMIGAGFLPLIIIIYFIFSFTIDFDNIFDLFKDLGDMKINNIILLVSYPFASGILVLLIFKTINDYSIFHMFVPFIIKKFIREIIGSENNIFF